VAGDEERIENFILFNRLALAAIKKDWWASNDRTVKLHRVSLRKAFTRSDLAFAFVMMGRWSADSQPDEKSPVNGMPASDSSTGTGLDSRVSMKRKKVCTGKKLEIAVDEYETVYDEELEQWWKSPQGKEAFKLWDEVLRKHDEERRVKGLGEKRASIEPEGLEKNGKKRKMNMASMLDDDGDSDIEGVENTSDSATSTFLLGATSVTTV